MGGGLLECLIVCSPRMASDFFFFFFFFTSRNCAIQSAGHRCGHQRAAHLATMQWIVIGNPPSSRKLTIPFLTGKTFVERGYFSRSRGIILFAEGSTRDVARSLRRVLNLGIWPDLGRCFNQVAFEVSSVENTRGFRKVTPSKGSLLPITSVCVSPS